MRFTTMALVVPLLTFGSLSAGSLSTGSPDGASGSGKSAAWTQSARGAAYRPPLDAMRVLRPFDPPPDRYGPGHLGVDLAAPAGAVARSAGDGVVRFAGRVAGRGVVVVVHADGISTEYEPLTVAVPAGRRVRAGDRLGTVAAGHRGCAPASCLHWGARRGGTYLDPMALLRPLGVVRLLPWQ